MASRDMSVFIDLDRMLIGVFDSTQEYQGDPGLVNVSFYEPNSWFSKPVLSEPVSRDFLHVIKHPNPDAVGGFGEWVVLGEGKGDSSLINLLNLKLVREKKELLKQLDDLKLELATTKHQLETAQSGAKKMLSESSELNQRRRSPFPSMNDPYSRFGEY